MTAPKATRDALYSSWHERLAKIQHELYRGFLQQKLWTEMRDDTVRQRPSADATFLVTSATPSSTSLDKCCSSVGWLR